MLGEHSEAVLRELGYAPAAIHELVASGVTRPAAVGNRKAEAAE
jgi:hypothetical protein